MKTLVVLRHGKSDWDVPATDADRPLGKRGRRQAEEAGQWLADHGPALDVAVLSPARRARETWERASGRLDEPPPVRVDEAAYTFDGAGL
ncbi:MAG: histidine phosphatase family protein, partial [Nocardioides sp.]|nr:histidine phosphatase family protein [Nocardioides sp.]